MSIYRTTSGVLEVEEDHITIKTLAPDDNVTNNEIVHWVDDEWREDPDIIPAIANAIALFFSEGAAAVAVRTGLDFDSDGDVSLADVGTPRATD